MLNKSEKGITLISLIVYVIVMLIVMTIIGTITSFFYSNVNEQYKESQDENSETILDMYLTNDLKNDELIITPNEETKSIEGYECITIEYKDGKTVIYTITENGIYRDKVKIYNKEKDTKFVFRLTNVVPKNSVINEKQELKIVKIIDTENGEESTFKTYTVNVKPKAVYPTVAPTALSN